MSKVLLCIMDGVGIRKNKLGNAYLNANTKTLDKLIKEYPHTYLEASGEYVGLPKGQMGNSEVGHSTIGSGMIYIILYILIIILGNRLNPIANPIIEPIIVANIA